MFHNEFYRYKKMEQLTRIKLGYEAASLRNWKTAVSPTRSIN